jgi:hypothetical protein
LVSLGRAYTGRPPLGYCRSMLASCLYWVTDD